MSVEGVSAVLIDDGRVSRATGYEVTGRKVLRNTSWNLFGSLAPLAVAALATPTLIARMGLERFGVLTLAWTLIGYTSLFDFGLGRALTKMVSELMGEGNEEQIPGVVWDSLLLLLVVGVAGGLIVAVASSWLVDHLLRVSVALRPETLRGFCLIAAAIPVVTTSTGLRGLLEAQQRFRSVNLVRSVMGLLGFAAPFVVVFFTNRLDIVIGSLAVARLGGWLGYFQLCVKSTPRLLAERKLGTTPLRPLVSFGGWLSVSNFLNPFVVSMDRFIIGAFLSMSMVAYYATPSELVLKILVIPMALQSVIFPAFSGNIGSNQRRVEQLYRDSNDMVFIVLFPLILLLTTFAPEALRIWLGPQFAAKSTLVLQLLALGALVNGMAHVPSMLIQGAGRPDLSAKIKLFETPIYLLITWWMIRHFGITGAGLAWMLRVFLDAVIMFAFARKWFRGAPFSLRSVIGGLAVIVVAGVMGYQHASLWLRSSLVLIALLRLAKHSRPVVSNYIQA